MAYSCWLDSRNIGCWPAPHINKGVLDETGVTVFGYFFLQNRNVNIPLPMYESPSTFIPMEEVSVKDSFH